LVADEESIFFDREINERLRGVDRMGSLDILLEQSNCSYNADEKNAMAEKKNSYYRQFLKDLSPADLLPGALSILKQLRQRRVKMGIGSSSKNTDLILKQVGLVGMVDVVVNGNDVVNSKPHPEIFLLAAEQMGVSASECLVVEDALAGIEAARRGGMFVFGIGTPEQLAGEKYCALNLGCITLDELLKAGIEA
jgi:beta-phosphoglucomutase